MCIRDRTCTLLGNETFVDIQISEWDVLSVNGDISVYDDWFETGDIIKEKDGRYWYYGRKNS